MNEPTDAQVARAASLMFDAFEATWMTDGGTYSVGWYTGRNDDIEASVSNIARALLAAGWKTPHDE
jgi:hypothetical protein